MRAPPDYMGIPIRTATPEQMRQAIMNGRMIHRKDGWTFYQYGGEVYVIDAHGELTASAAKDEKPVLWRKSRKLKSGPLPDTGGEIAGD